MTTDASRSEIDNITEELKTCDDPIKLASYLTKLSGWASYYSEMMKKIQLRKPVEWLQIKETQFSMPSTYPQPKEYSDQKTEMLYGTTEDGQKEIALKWELRRIEQMTSAIKQRLYADRVDFKGL